MIRHRRVLFTVLLLCLVCTFGSGAFGFDGYVISIRFQSDSPGDIHDDSTPGQLILYPLQESKVQDAKVLYSPPSGITEARIGPFGRRVAFCRADGTLGFIEIETGSITELGRFATEEQVKKSSPASTGIQWPATDAGRWIYYTNLNNQLQRIDLQTKTHETIVIFNRDVNGEFALSPDATPSSGYFIKRTDNYAVVIYNLANGDGDLYSVPVWSPGCGIGISPDGSMFASNDGTHTVCTLVDIHARRQHSFRISQWDGDPTQGVREREKLGWAWQHFRWSTNDMEWITVKQAPLIGASTHAIQFSDAMLYNWTQQKQINLTRNQPGTFDRPCGAWSNQTEQLLGYFRGEAPYTVELTSPQLKGTGWTWTTKDGTRLGTGVKLRHTFNEPGVFNLLATRRDERFRAQVTVEPRQAPTATVQFVDHRRLLVSFDEPVTGKGSVRLANNLPVEQAHLSATGRQLSITLGKPLTSDTQLRLSGYTDRAQKPNPVDPAPISLTVPGWPTNHDGAIYHWESERSSNLIYSPSKKSILPSRLRGDYDREGWVRFAGGQAGTGFFSQTGQGMDFNQVVSANRFSMEALIHPDELSQPAAPGGFPRRIINCSAWHDGDWNFLLGQLDDKLVVSIRTIDNFLDTDGNPTRDSLHGRAPVIELFTLPDTDPHHVVVTYEPGKLKAYVDGKLVHETEQVTGNLKWGYGELIFGGSHNSGRQRWRGRTRNMALYARALSADEVAANYAAIQKTTKPLPRITVRARLLKVSTAPSPQSIAPYTEALIVNEYQVLEILGSANGWNNQPPVGANDTIRVYQWGLIGKKKTPNAQLKPGAERELTLEAHANHPGKLDEVVTSHELDLQSSAAVLYEPR